MTTPPQASALWRWAKAASLGGLLLVVVGALGLAAARRPLWFDELFSYYIAQQDTAAAVLRSLVAGADNGPPLDYLLRHACMATLGDSALAFRLPSLAALAVAMACLWTFARRRMSRAAAATALVLPLGTLATHYATEGRAYCGLLALASLSLLAWQRALDGRRRGRWLAVLSLALFAGPLWHYYGVFNYVPVLVGEAVRVVRQRKISIAMLACLAGSLTSLAVVPVFARHAVEMKEHFWADPAAGSSPLLAHRQLLGRALWPALILGALGLLTAVGRARARPREPLTEGASDRGLRPSELAAAVALAMIPAFVWLAALLYTNAATDRYGIAAIAGFALLSAEGVRALQRRGGHLVWVVPALLLAGGLATTREIMTASGTDPLPPGLAEFVDQSSDWVAVDNPLLFMQAFHYLPDVSKPKLIYLADRAASLRHLGFDNDDIAIPNLQQVVGLQTQPFAEFCARHRRFYVLGDRRRYWLLAELANSGARIHTVDRFDRVEAFRVELPEPR